VLPSFYALFPFVLSIYAYPELQSLLYSIDNFNLNLQNAAMHQAELRLYRTRKI